MILSDKKNKKIARLISISLTIILILLPIIFFFTRHHYDQQGANIKNFTTSELIATDKDTNLFEQTFFATNDELDSLIFYLKNTSYINELELSIFDHSQDMTIRQESFKISPQDNIQILAWNFENIYESKNKKFSLFIMPKKNDIQLLGTSSELYEAGELFVNGKKSQELILAFSIDYYSNNLLNILHDRLGIYKPAIFSNTWSFYILYLLVLLSITYISYQLSLVILKGK